MKPFMLTIASFMEAVLFCSAIFVAYTSYAQQMHFSQFILLGQSLVTFLVVGPAWLGWVLLAGSNKAAPYWYIYSVVAETSFIVTCFYIFYNFHPVF